MTIFIDSQEQVSLIGTYLQMGRLVQRHLVGQVKAVILDPVPIMQRIIVRILLPHYFVSR